MAHGRLRARVVCRGLWCLFRLANRIPAWSIADAERGPRTMGTIEPERISEVVSDIVESQSGYLEVGFEVPSGGAFRVIDVIVTEAPRFNPSANSR